MYGDQAEEWEKVVKENLKRYNEFREDFKKKFPDREMMKITVSKYPSSKTTIKLSELLNAHEKEEDNEMYTWKLTGYEEKSKNSETKKASGEEE